MPVKLGELLVTEKVISPEQLDAGLQHQKESGGRLGQALVSLGLIGEKELITFLSRKLGVPSLDLHYFEVDPAIIKIIPAETARKYQVLPLSLSGKTRKTLAIAMDDPTNVFAMDDIKFMTGYNVEPVLASQSQLKESIERHYGPARSDKPELPALTVDGMAGIGALTEIDLGSMTDAEADVETVQKEEDEIDLGALSKSADAAPIIKLTNVILVDSLKRGASDIHIEPYEREFRVRFRIDGVLYNVMALPMLLKDPLTSRVKIMAKLDITQKRLPQNGWIKIKMKVEDRSRELDFRVSVRPTLWGEKIVMRLLDKSTLILDMTKLGFEPQSLERFKNAINKPYGVVLVTGPTGSGKTNTLYSAIASLNKPDTNIMTVEDPVEFNLPGINQVQINEHLGETFATVLRSFFRQDPNIILVGEIRDKETAQIALKLALTGHLVLTTLYTNDAPSTVSRMVNMGIEPFLVGTAVTLIQTQRLIRRVCSSCKTDITAEVPPKNLIEVGFAPEQVGTFNLFKGKGCGACNGTGYKGRIGLYEVMEISESIRDLIMVGATALEIKKKARDEGMLTLRDSGLEKIKAGVTTIEEVLREAVL